MLTRAIMVAIFLLPGCADSIQSSKAPDKSTEKCPAPVTIPEANLTDAQIEILWGRDRTNLVICEGRRAALEESITGTNPSLNSTEE